MFLLLALVPLTELSITWTHGACSGSLGQPKLQCVLCAFAGSLGELQLSLCFVFAQDLWARQRIKMFWCLLRIAGLAYYPWAAWDELSISPCLCLPRILLTTLTSVVFKCLLGYFLRNFASVCAWDLLKIFGSIDVSMFFVFVQDLWAAFCVPKILGPNWALIVAVCLPKIL